MSKEEMLTRVSVMRASVELLNYQIKNLGQHFAPLQVTAWRKHRAKINKQIKFYKQLIRKL